MRHLNDAILAVIEKCLVIAWLASFIVLWFRLTAADLACFLFLGFAMIYVRQVRGR